MSRWLKSVNNLLDNLDGQAENVADNVADNLGGIDSTIGQLLEKGQQVVAGFGDASFDTDDSDYEDDEEEFSSESEDLGETARNDDEFSLSAEVEEKLGKSSNEAYAAPPADSASHEEVKLAKPKSTPQLHPPPVAWNDSKHSLNKTSLHLNIHRGASLTVESVSEITFAERSDYTEGIVEENSEITSAERSDYTEEVMEENNPVALATEATPSAYTDRTPNPPNRLDSFSVPLLLSLDGTENPRKELENRNIYVPQVTAKALTPTSDRSPRPPRRFMGGEGLQKSVAQIALDDHFSTDEHDLASDEGGYSGYPPKPPTRKLSIPEAKQLEEVQEKRQNKIQTASTPVSNQSTSQLIQKSIKMNENEMQKLRLQVQSLMDKLNESADELSRTNTKLNKASNELKNSQAETKKVEIQVKSLDTQLQAANTEIHAQSEELRRAGERMEKDRKTAHDDREELLDEQDEEIEQLKAQQTTELEEIKMNYEKQISELTNQLQTEEKKRMQEDGDWTQEMEDAVGRERDALKKLNEVKLEKVNLEQSVSKLEIQQKALQSKLSSTLQSAETASEREKKVQDKLDASLSQHARQMTQRQAREAELEKTIFEMGTALTVEKEKQQNLATKPPKSEIQKDNFKEKYESLIDEADTLKSQLNFETQRRVALQQELSDITQERSEEISSAQARQQEHDRKVNDLESRIGKLKISIHELKSGSVVVSTSTDGKNSRHSSELEGSEREVVRLSDQLMRHQRRLETSKTEVLALKGRLQTATSRAEEAEKSLLAAQASSGYSSGRGFRDLESGGYSRQNGRRRVKGGVRLRSGSASHQIRSMLNIGPGRNSSYAVEQASTTIDALDKWIVDTGSFMRHEPLARLGFLLYLLTLHLWSFALVVFHTIEEPHADFGTVDNNPRHWRAHA
jgi:hypothetical protein